MDNSVTHIAGCWVGFNGRAVQRCAWCGEKLRDTKGEMVVSGDNDTDEKEAHRISASFWDPMTLVRCREKSQVAVGFFDEVGALPYDICKDLVE